MSRLLLVMVVLAVAPAAFADGVCSDAIQGKIAWNDKGAKRWNPNNIDRLCKGAERTTEPARCFDEVMHGDVERGPGRWGWSRAIDLCRGTHDAAARIGCLEDRVARGAGTNDAIKACQAADSEPGERRARQRSRAVMPAESMVVLDPDDNKAVLTAPERQPSGGERVIHPDIGKAVREAILQQAAQDGRRRSCEQVPLTRDGLRLDRATAGGEELKLEGCLGNPARDSVLVWIQSGDRIERERARFHGTYALARAPRIAFDDGAVVSLVRTLKQGETFQLTPEIPIGRAVVDADGDSHMAPEWGGDDCDDSDPRRFPGNTEMPDAAHLDEDCDPTTYGEVDEDRDRFFSDKYCNEDPSGRLICGRDCDDRYANVNPAHSETPGDGLDNDCDGDVDEGY